MFHLQHSFVYLLAATFVYDIQAPPVTSNTCTQLADLFSDSKVAVAGILKNRLLIVSDAVNDDQAMSRNVYDVPASQLSSTSLNLENVKPTKLSTKWPGFEKNTIFQKNISQNLNSQLAMTITLNEAVLLFIYSINMSPSMVWSITSVLGSLATGEATDQEIVIKPSFPNNYTLVSTTEKNMFYAFSSNLGFLAQYQFNSDFHQTAEWKVCLENSTIRGQPAHKNASCELVNMWPTLQTGFTDGKTFYLFAKKNVYSFDFDIINSTSAVNVTQTSYDNFLVCPAPTNEEAVVNFPTMAVKAHKKTKIIVAFVVVVLLLLVCVSAWLFVVVKSFGTTENPSGSVVSSASVGKATSDVSQFSKVMSLKKTKRESSANVADGSNSQVDVVKNVSSKKTRQRSNINKLRVKVKRKANKESSKRSKTFSRRSRMKSRSRSKVSKRKSMSSKRSKRSHHSKKFAKNSKRSVVQHKTCSKRSVISKKRFSKGKVLSASSKRRAPAPNRAESEC